MSVTSDGTVVERRDGEAIDGLLRRFKRQVEEGGVLRTLRERRRGVTPAARRRLKDRRAAHRRERTAARRG